MITVIAGAVVVLILVWLFGSGLARFVGVLLLIDGLGGIAIRNGFDNPRFAVEAVIGLGLWLFGHWLFAAKYGQYRSRLAQRVWRLPVLGWVAPVRRIA